MKNELYFNINEVVDATDKLVKEKDTIGYYDLPNQDITYIKNYLKKFDNKDIETIVIIGIGGSSLGIQAIYDFLRYDENLTKRMVFLDSTDPLFLKEMLESFNLVKAHFMIISKSGNTIETISIYKYVYQKLCSLNLDLKEYFTFITDEGSNLQKYANNEGFNVVNIQANIGGRFSVLSSVGLIPLALAGIDVKEILSGANEVKKEFFNNGEINQTLQKKASFMASHFDKHPNNCIFAYSERLKYFVSWYVQLWGESLGKKQTNSQLNVGLTPIGLIGPKDQHSFLQLIEDGPRDKSITFIKVNDFVSDLKVPDIKMKFLEGLDNINNLEFETIINMQADSIVESLLYKSDIPVDIIEIDHINERSIGKLIYYYELLTSLVGEFLGVNTYNQPGVEAGKKILKTKLQNILKD
ncbi:MAG: Glucose-6-phosphate isomerase (EC [uncultured Campylobacterales bacterium]|uniref:Glucose-6-phosphate isomerase n=1 Tax=uncultured Campylobacterales bacterium TaxID=352960 RepID=A0A6S6SML5_9BACT|nr:MAG: Glucose-6-phosphate isomerase (EC [uncultured Campylobacterales bacterium]